MKFKQYLISIADGIFQGFCGTKLLLGVTFSQFASEAPLQTHIIIGCLIALFTAIIYFLFMHEEGNNKNLLKFSAISFLCFIVSSPILFALPFSIFPQREIGNADGFIIMFIFTSFLITAIVIRLGILIGMFIKNKKQL